MQEFTPKLITSLKTYTKKQFTKDLLAGVIVAIIALPLSIALSLASGVGPEKGIYTAIVAGFVAALFSGSIVQVSGTTAAFATVVAGIVAVNGIDALITASIMAGIILIIAGFFKFGSLIKFIPYTITMAFTSGIAFMIFTGQIKEFLGLKFNSVPIETIDKLRECVTNISTVNWQAVLVGAVSLAILIIWPKINKVVPASLVAVVAASLLVEFTGLKVNTIGSLYEIPRGLPPLTLPSFSFDLAVKMLPDAFTIALLSGIVSLLSCVVTDNLTGDKHRSNMELIAQGIGNIFAALFGGIPLAGAVARTTANVKTGGRTPISAMVHSVVLLLILLLLIPFAEKIPMPTTAAILLVVAYNMSGWREFVNLIKSSPKSDIIILFSTFIMTVAVDLVIAIVAGIVLAALLLMRRLSNVLEVSGWKYVEDGSDMEAINLRIVPKNTLVYEINGPLFYASTEKITDISLDNTTKVLVLRMRAVPAIDISAINALKKLKIKCENNGAALIFSHVTEQPLKIIKKSGLYEKVGQENFCANIDTALKRAENLCNVETNENKDVLSV